MSPSGDEAVPREIACVIREPAPEGELMTEVGGPGWRADLETVIGQIESGRCYYVEIGSVRFRVRVQVQGRAGRRSLGTDPDESPRNQLRSLPSCS